jgi:hypothetical protein
LPIKSLTTKLYKPMRRGRVPTAPELEADELNIDEMCNQLCCNPCLFCPTRSASWWGNETDFPLEEEASFDIDAGKADETLQEEVPWHIMVSVMKSNQKLVPSTGGSKTKYYSMVTNGNVSRKWENECKAVRMEMDNKRKRQERKKQKEEANEAGLKRTKLHDIRKYLVKKTTMYPSVQALLFPPRLNFDEELQTLREEPDAAVMHMRCTSFKTGEASTTQGLSIREGLKSFQIEMLKTNHGAAAILIQAYLKYEEHLRHGKSDLTAGRLVAQNFYTKETRPTHPRRSTHSAIGIAIVPGPSLSATAIF